MRCLLLLCSGFGGLALTRVDVLFYRVKRGNMIPTGGRFASLSLEVVKVASGERG